LALPALSVPLAEALSSTAIVALIRPLGLPDMLLHRREALSSQYEAWRFNQTSPAYRIAFLKKALRNLSMGFSFF
jgi:hypothetical protein